MKRIKLNSTDIKRIVKRVLSEQELPVGHVLDDSGTIVDVTINNGFDTIEDKEAIEIMRSGHRVNLVPNLMEFPNVFVVNFLNGEPLTDIDVNSILNHPKLSRLIFNYVDSPMMNSKVNELENSEAVNDGGVLIQANKIEREQR